MIILVFVISLSCFTAFANKFPTGLELKQKNFFSEKHDDGKKIIIFGSSHVGQLNTTNIDSILNSNEKNYQIYNLAYNADLPSRRLQFVDEINDLRPIIIIYGISYRDLQTSINENPLPDPKYFFNQISKQVIHNDITVNPKLITLNFIRNLQGEQNNRIISYPNTPFFIYNPETQIHITNEIELEKDSGGSEVHLEMPEKNSEVKSLIELIHKFQKNHIKVVLFLTPLNNHYLQSVDPLQHLIFNSTINYVKKETNIPIYDL